MWYIRLFVTFLRREEKFIVHVTRYWGSKKQNRVEKEEKKGGAEVVDGLRVKKASKNYSRVKAAEDDLATVTAELSVQNS